MLSTVNWRPIALCALMGALGLAAVCPAMGQEARKASTFSLTQASDVELVSLLMAGEPVPAPPLPSGNEPEATPDEPPAATIESLLGSEVPLETDVDLSPSHSRSMVASRSPMIRLAGLPNMFGDSFGPQVSVCDFAGCGIVDIPPPGGSRRVKIAENDKALPMDRVFFNYNHFQNVIDASVAGLGTRAYPLDQYTLGCEKTFRDGLWSVELRMPFSQTPDVVGTNMTVTSGDVGNLAVTVKRLLYASRTTAVGVGLPIETPTGNGVTGYGTQSQFELANESVHLAPFVGFLTAPNDRVFCQGFLQVDVPVGGNSVSFGGTDLGTLTEQNLFYVDLAMGYWLFNEPHARSIINGMAFVLEYHYTTTLDDAEIVSGTDGNQLLRFGNPDNRLDMSNLTVGLHTQMGKTSVRVGGVFPLSSGSNRLYDGEVQISLNRRF